MPSWAPLPEFDAASLSLEKMQELAKGLQPFALTGVSWEGDGVWKDTAQMFSLLKKHDSGVCTAEMMLGEPSDMTSDFVDSATDELPLSEALSLLSTELGSSTPASVYMKYALMSPELLIALPFHSFYTKKGLIPVDIPLLLKPGCFFTWVYAGTKATGSKTHIDILNSSAWLTLLSGSKKWLLVHGEDHDKAKEAAGGVPNLFSLFAAPEGSGSGAEGGPWGGVRLFEYDQKPGTAVFVPSKCLHAVFNTENSTSLTHNFVDETNQPHWETAIKDMIGAS
eukprot:TRINITY_DN4720_c0_g3_i1.p1 TRINITY_DN4720_c0_g3~~TRINITY_DN4720_c0_g3_i1.p1  ORF type:complete len:281 (+),score=100.06 TRINITY_DN4720_c0_g3_i1:126-968(+)